MRLQLMVIVAIYLTLPVIAAGADEPTANAAELYNRACALLPDLTSRPDMDLLEDASKHVGQDAAPGSDEVQELLRRCEPAIELVRQADGAKRCDWELPAGVDDLKVGHANRMSRLFSVLLLHARSRLALGDQATAVQDFRSAMKLGTRLCDERSLVWTLQGVGMNLATWSTLARELHRLSPRSLREVDAAIAKADPATALERTWHDDAPRKLHELALAARTERALLRAAIAVRLEGPDAVRRSKDPAGDGPFTYESLGSGNAFRLQSKLLRNGAQVKLEVAESGH